jgi:hypothetical protein
VNLFTQTVAMQIRAMARDQSGASSRKFVRLDLPCKFVDREWWEEPDWEFWLNFLCHFGRTDKFRSPFHRNGEYLNELTTIIYLSTTNISHSMFVQLVIPN